MWTEDARGGGVSAKCNGVLLTDSLCARSRARNIAVLLEVDHNLRVNRAKTLRKSWLSLPCRMLSRCQGKDVVPSSEGNCQRCSHHLYRLPSPLLIACHHKDDSYQVMSSPASI